MHLRRLLIVVLAFSMIRVTLSGSDLVCAEHDSVHAHAVIGHSGPGHSSGLPASGKHDTPPCETASPAVCCQALGSCGVSIALGEERRIIEPFFWPEPQYGSRSVVRSSRVIAPEPPPPKA